ncbi:hypothetical protein [Lacticaseibacillus porcinae]|uniref:hypothetical protein n=1 Tax=Lacticaseibacillus porcinae TaxID=1123687 RepID=UPI000F76C966|nr:hypothetical protein [Lacticaseibacillus porcinae]
MLKKFQIIAGLALMLTLAGCGQKKANPTASSSKPKTVLTTKQYTTAQLQKRYVTIVDAVVDPLDLASYSKPTATIQQAATKGKQQIADVQLQLADNSGQPALNTALQKLGKAATAMLTAMVGKDQATYNTTAKTFMSQTNTIAKTYFNGQIPPKLNVYSQRMANKTSSSAASTN